MFEHVTSVNFVTEVLTDLREHVTCDSVYYVPTPKSILRVLLLLQLEHQIFITIATTTNTYINTKLNPLLTTTILIFAFKMYATFASANTETFQRSESRFDALLTE